MALVSYASSSDGSDADTNTDPNKSRNALKRKRTSNGHTNHDNDKRTSTTTANKSSDLPPLPASFHDLYASNARTSTHDDPSLHGGRKRGIPHVVGNWVSHVYLEWRPTSSESYTLTELIRLIELHSPSPSSTHTHEDSPCIHSLLHSPLSVPLPLHISLSRTLPLRTPQRDAFHSRLASAIARTGVRPFSIPLNLPPKWESNHDRSRWFLVLPIKPEAASELGQLLKSINGVAEEFGMEKLYAGRSGDIGNSVPDDVVSSSSSSHQSRKRLHLVGSSDMDTSSPQLVVSAPASEQEREQDQNLSGFHISIAWSLSPPPPNSAWHSTILSQPSIKCLLDNHFLLLPCDQKSSAETDEMKKEIPKGLSVRFDSVKVKIGNVVESVGLGKR